MSEEARDTDASGAGGGAASPARPLKRRGLVVMVLLALGILTDVGALLAELDQLAVLGELDRGVDVSFEEVTASDDLIGFTAIARVVVFVATVIAFLAWFHRAYRNVPGLGVREPRFRYGWAIGSWFVPILNLIRPKQIANDIWRASEAGAPVDHHWRDFSQRRVSPLLHLWWASWLIAGAFDRVATRLYLDAESISSQQNASYLSIVTIALFAVAAVMAILVVRAMTRRYEARRAELAGAATTP